jgi:hypothetical protein
MTLAVDADNRKELVPAGMKIGTDYIMAIFPNL